MWISMCALVEEVGRSLGNDCSKAVSYEIRGATKKDEGGRQKGMDAKKRHKRLGGQNVNEEEEEEKEGRSGGSGDEAPQFVRPENGN
ncbi:hypothetical protein B9Z55_019170 [Caenorhabditis nigoni]|nr:hypothetical protein B9Z55_019170 [Caenorhabditis nigoni]